MHRLIVAICALFVLSEHAPAQTLMPPGGPDVCGHAIVFSGQEAAVDADAREIRLRAQGAFATTRTSSATATFEFEAFTSYGATVRLPVSYVGRLDNGANAAARSEIHIDVELFDVTEGTQVGDTSEVLDIVKNDLGPQVLNSVIVDPVAEIEADLENGHVYEVRLRTRTVARGLGASSNFLTGNRLIGYSCVEVESELIDTDGDGIFDIWETVGIDIDNDGVAELPSDQIGTDFAGNPIALDPMRKDILVEIDYFTCAEPGGDCDAGDGHSHRPRAGVLADAVDVFDQAPVANPGPEDGIALWVVEDEALAHQDNCDLDDGCFDGLKEQFFGTPSERGDPDLIAAKALVFRYALWVHNKEEGNSSSGEADGSAGVPGDDFVVSLGSPNWSGGTGSAGEQLGTFIHELGHTLGLGHGGGDNVNCKPNYVSLMNYIFQVDGIEPLSPTASLVFDLSRTEDPAGDGTLVENDLDEPLGIGDVPFISYHGPPADLDGGIDNNGDGDATDDWLTVVGGAPVDWDNDGDATDDPAQPTDINHLEITGCTSAGGVPDPAPDQELAGFVDWDILMLNFRDSPFFPAGAHGQEADVEELDAETARRIRDAKWRARTEPRYRYDAKLVCGTERDGDSLRLTQGRYGSVINILNRGKRPTRLRKSLALAYPPAEQAPGDTFFIAIDRLEPDTALKVDCEDVRQNVFDGEFPASVIDGLVTILSPQPLDVQGVYTTTAVDDDGRATGHSSIEIEAYAGVDQAFDLAVRKRGVFASAEIGALTDYLALFEVAVENTSETDALGVTVVDRLSLLSEGLVAVAFPLDDPIELPEGGSLDAIVLEPAGARIDFSFGDIAAGASKRVRFLAFIRTYDFSDAEDRLLLTNAAVASAPGLEVNGNNNDDFVTLELDP